jgi:hypothetical protein
MTYPLGFTEVLDREISNGSHLINVAHVCSVRPQWDENEEWTHCNINMVDGRVVQTREDLDTIIQYFKCAYKAEESKP